MNLHLYLKYKVQILSFPLLPTGEGRLFLCESKSQLLAQPCFFDWFWKEKKTKVWSVVHTTVSSCTNGGIKEGTCCSINTNAALNSNSVFLTFGSRLVILKNTKYALHCANHLMEPQNNNKWLIGHWLWPTHCIRDTVCPIPVLVSGKKG